MAPPSSPSTKHSSPEENASRPSKPSRDGIYRGHGIPNNNSSQNFDTKQNEQCKEKGIDPWMYRGKQLEHLDFPLGGIGTGNILLQGDGCLRGWDVMNQFHSSEHRPVHNPPTLGKGSGKNEKSNNCNCWAISAAYDDDDVVSGGESDEHCETTETWVVVEKTPRPSIILRSANHYGEQENGDNEVESGTGFENAAMCPPESVPAISVQAKYPIAQVSYETPPSFPLTNIRMEAMTPLVPSDSRASGYPMAVFVVRFENPHPTRSVSVDVMQSTINFLGWDGGRKKDGVPSRLLGGNLNEPFIHSTEPLQPPPTENGPRATENDPSESNSKQYSCQGLFLHTKNDLKRDLTRKGSIALSAIFRSKSSNNPSNTTQGSSSTTAPTVGLISGASSEDELFRRFQARDFEDVESASATPPSPEGTTYAGAVVQSLSKIPPASTASVIFCLSWHFPYRPCTTPRANLPQDFYGNLYASWFDSAKDVAIKFCDTFANKKSKKNLLDITRHFVDALYGSTIPWQVLESAAGRLAIARSPTLFRTEAGIVLGNEGNGHGPLNGTHVFGYTTLLERIFPDLAQDMLTSVFVRNFDLNNGGCLASFGEGGFAIDGALASISKAYLVVRQSDPGLDFLKSIWTNLKRQLSLIVDKLVTKDGVIIEPQQTTYGGSIEGANTLVGSHLLTALRATEAMATLVGDVNFAKKCSKQASTSLEGYERLCWREDLGYYVATTDQHSRKHSESNYSYGSGCCLDQLTASGLSRACGFGSIFDPAREARARRSIVRNNTVTSPPFTDEDFHLGRGDSGLRVCTYPLEEKERMPFSNKVASGLEYSLVAGLIGDSNWEDAAKVCDWIRIRQSGARRSPWNEPEKGLYAARSMSGWNLFDQSCGLEYNSTTAMLKVLPKINSADFSCFCAFHGGFGEFKQNKQQTRGATEGFTSGRITRVALKIWYGSVELKTLQVDDASATAVVASLDNKQDVKASIANGVIALDTKLVVEEDSTLELVLSKPSQTSTTAKNASALVQFLTGTEKVLLPPIDWYDRRKRRLLLIRCLGVLVTTLVFLNLYIFLMLLNVLH